MHKHVVLVIQTHDPAQAFQIADRTRGFKRNGNQITVRKGHVSIAGTQTEQIAVIHPIAAVQPDTEGEVACTSGCVNVN